MFSRHFRLLCAAKDIREVLRSDGSALVPAQPLLHRALPEDLHRLVQHRAQVGNREVEKRGQDFRSPSLHRRNELARFVGNQTQ